MKRATLTCAVMLALAGCGEKMVEFESTVGPDPVLPPPNRDLIPAMSIAEVVGWQKGETPVVAPGLKIEALATDLRNPRNVFVLPNGDVLVVEARDPGVRPKVRPKDVIKDWVMSIAHGNLGGGEKKEANRITLLRDADRDGVPEVRTVFLDNLYSPFGVTLVGQDLYVANTDGIVRYPYQTGQTQITAPGTMLTPLPAWPVNHHWTKSLVASPDGSLLYASVGSNSNVAERGMEVEDGRAAIWEVDRATGRSRLYATGLRNPNGLTFHPETGELWAAVNERDEIGPNLVPDYITSVREGGFYGWPYSYWGQHLDERVMPRRPDLVERAIKPDYSVGSHVAPLGMAFSYGDGMPANYRGGAFVGEHGSWNRENFVGYKVVWVPFSGGRPSGMPQDVVTGFLTDEGEARGRPVGLAMDQAGALLIADDAGGAVWRVSAAQ